MRRFAIVLLILIGVVFGLYKWNFPTASYRYRLTVAVEVNGQIHSGSSVIEVRYRFNPQFLSVMFGMYDINVKGQAAVVDLGTPGVLVAALGDNSDPSTVSAAFLAARAFQASAQQGHGSYEATLDRVRALSQMRGAVPLAPNNMPPLIWFPSRTNPRSGRAVRANDLGTVIGNDAKLVSAEVAITHDPINIDIPKKLPLYNSLPPPPRSESLELPNGHYLNWGMFIAPGSVP